MIVIVVAAGFAAFCLLTFAAWRRYVWVAEKTSGEQGDTCPYMLTDVFDGQEFLKVPHQKGVRWLSEVFSRPPRGFPTSRPCRFPTQGSH